MQRDYYSEKAWGSSPKREDLEERERLVIARLSNQSKQTGHQVSFLDLGCGDGCFLSFIMQQQPKWRYFGVDGSEPQLKKANERGLHCQFKLADITQALPYPDSFFDIVYSGEVLEHLPNPDLFLSEIHRVLKPSGMLVITTPNLMSWYNRLLLLFGISPIFVEYSSRDSSVGYGPLKRLKKSEQPVGHLRIFHSAALSDLLSLCGFNSVKIHASRFDYLPEPMRTIDSWISRYWTNAGSILIAFALKNPQAGNSKDVFKSTDV